MVSLITAEAAKDRLHRAQEFAVIDVREAGQFGEGHLLFAAPCAYSRLELEFPRLVPRISTEVILVDDGDGVAERAAQRLEGLGYASISILDGGVAAWEAAGFSLFKGVNVPSKLLGELAEHHFQPQRLSANELANWKAAGKSFHFFDTRPPAEHEKMRVPGARCLPNGELAHRLAAAVPDETATILLTCAGRTRGLIGAASLMVAGFNNPVFALENGTQGWTLAGFDLERGNTAQPFPDLDSMTFSASQKRAERVMADDDIPAIDAAGLAAFLEDQTRTTHVLDVRSEAEASADPIAVARHALSGQLIQSTDQWIGTRRSRVVLIDDAGLRAALAAYWLKRMGYEPYVHRLSPATYDLKSTATVQLSCDVDCIAPQDAVAALKGEGELFAGFTLINCFSPEACGRRDLVHTSETDTRSIDRGTACRVVCRQPGNRSHGSKGFARGRCRECLPDTGWCWGLAARRP